MPVFAYRAFTDGGRATEGIVDADSRQSAWETLRARGVFPTTLQDTLHDTLDDARATTGGRVASAEVAGLLRQLAVLVRGGVPLADALEDAAGATRDRTLDAALTIARARVREGGTLADALAASPHVFPPAWCALVRAGEAGGTLGDVLVRLATHAEAMAALQSRVRAALVYPAVVGTVTVLTLGALLVWVVPQMAAVMAETGARVPPLSRLLLSVAGGLQATWWLWAIALVAGGVAVATWLRTPAGRARRDALLPSLPVVGPIAVAAAHARALRTLGTLLASGVRMEDALELAAAAAGSGPVGDAVRAAREAARTGGALAPALRAHPIVAAPVVRLVATGERGGTLPEALEHAAAAQDAEVERRVVAATALLEPALVLVLGVAVLLVVLAVLVPLLSLDPFAAP
jgi:general secretion pathway protein F